MLFFLILLLAFFQNGYCNSQLESEWGYYTLNNWAQTAYGWTGLLTFQPAVNGTLPPYDTVISSLNLTIYCVSDSILRVKILDPNNARWEVPKVVVLEETTTAFLPQNYRIRTSLWYEPFYLSIERVTGEVVFNSNYLYFSNQYLQWGTTLLPTANIYGLGERSWSLRYDLTQTRTFSFLSSDQMTPPKLPLYSSYPFYINLDQATGRASGAFLLNSNLMDVELGPGNLVYKTIGGILDVWLFFGPSPNDVLTQFQTVTGTPLLPPLWGLGYHQCRWGYKNLSQFQAVVEQFEQLQIPADTFWTDIDYMQNWKVWTTDPVLWPANEFGAFVRELHTKNWHYVPIVDPGVKIEDGYAVYEDGLVENAFVMDPDNAAPAVGKVWPGRVHFPDWTSPSGIAYWKKWIANFSATIPVDGLWIDMNEVASFCDGRCKVPATEDLNPDLFTCNCTLEERFNTGTWDDPPYVPVDARKRGCRAIQGDIHGVDISTMSMASHYYAGREYDYHHLYGFLEGFITQEALQDVRGKRAFIISRSVFPGSGRVMGKWLGDNWSQWSDLRASVPGILAMSIMGMPLIGADVCGFAADTTFELCERWMTLGAFYPFFRNHNHQDSISQEPYALGPAHLNTSMWILNVRYSLLPYLYTLFYLAHTQGGTVARPLFYDFPHDPHTYSIDEQFLFGPNLLVSPVLEQGVTSVSAYFPLGARWYNYWNGELLVDETAENRYFRLDTPVNAIQVHVKGGTITAHQVPGLTSTNQTGNPYQLLVALKASTGEGSSVAQGDLYIDDGDSIDSVSSQSFIHLKFAATSYENGFKLKSNVLHNGYKPNSRFHINQITVYGAGCSTGCVSIGGGNANSIDIESHFKLTGLSFAVNETFEVTFTCGECSSDSSQVSTAGIVGIVLGSIIFIILVFVFCYKRNQKWKNEHILLDDRNQNETAPGYRSTTDE